MTDNRIKWIRRNEAWILTVTVVLLLIFLRHWGLFISMGLTAGYLTLWVPYMTVLEVHGGTITDKKAYWVTELLEEGKAHWVVTDHEKPVRSILLVGNSEDPIGVLMENTSTRFISWHFMGGGTIPKRHWVNKYIDKFIAENEKKQQSP